jgi:hypothetical protein
VAKGIRPYAAVPRVSKKKGTSIKPTIILIIKYNIFDIKFIGNLCLNLMSRDVVLMMYSYWMVEIFERFIFGVVSVFRTVF